MSDLQRRIDLLMRRGDLLNPLGLLRSARVYDDTLRREDYERIIARNYHEDENRPLSDAYKKRVLAVWVETIPIFEGLGIVKESSNDVIVLKKASEMAFF